MGRETEVLVIGGGPAGMAAAIAARQKGFQVTVADGAKPPIDKACGEGLMPRTLASLRQLGVIFASGEGRSFRGIRFLDEVTAVEALFAGESGLGVRRTVLHQKMVQHAAECGAELRWDTRVSALAKGGAIVGGKLLQAKWIIGADGIHSRVARWCGLGERSPRTARFAQRRHYRLRPWSDCVEVYWGRGMQAYVTPLANDETCVVLISRDPKMRFEEAVKEFPKLAASLSKAELCSVQRGAVTAMCRLDRVFRDNVALIGDASGSVDAITGEGLGLSFQQALALADVLKSGELERYQSAHQRLAKQPRMMSRLLLLLDRVAPLRRRMLCGLAKDAGLFNRLLVAHTGEIAPFLVETSTRLGWRLLTE